TPMLSLTATKSNMSLEADLCLLLQEDVMLREGPAETKLVFAECKTLNAFEVKDIDRMRSIGQEFPGAILAFSTLREELQDDEKSLMIPLVDESRKNRANQQVFNQILILTGVEI